MNIKICLRIIIVLSLVFNKCNTNPEKVDLKNFPTKIDLKAQKFKTNNIVNVSSFVGIQDSILIVSNYQDSHVLYFINKNDFSLIEKVIKRGKGPHEIPLLLRGSDLDNSKPVLYYKSGNNNTIYKLLMLEDTHQYIDFMKIKNPVDIFEMEIIDDSLLCYIGSRNYAATLLNKKGDTIKNIGRLPEKPEGIKKANYNNMYTRFFTVNSEKKQIAVGYNRKDHLISYNLKGKKIFEKIGPDVIEPTYKNLYKPNERKAYESLRSDRDYIYCLYSGRKAWQFKDGATSLNNIKDNYSKSILIFDWEGNPKLRVNLSHECRDFIIDKETNRLITLSLEEEPFHVYDFSKIEQALN